MFLEKLSPKQFTSRLFLMAFVSGLVPIVIFTVLINAYGKRIGSEFTRIVEIGYRQDMLQSEIVLRSEGETSIYIKVNEMARQLDSTIASMPWASAEDLRRDSKFRDLAVQSISQTGYTYLFDAKTCIVLFNSDKRSEGENLLYVFRGSPDFLSILEASLRGPNVARGYYQVGAGNSHLVKRFVCMVPLNNRTADGTRFIVTAVVNAEGLSAAVKNAEEIHRTTKNYLAVASEQAIRSFRHSALLFMGTGIIIVSLLAFGLGLYFPGP